MVVDEPGVVLRVDPWEVDHGGSLELDDELSPPPVELDVEPVPWAPVAPDPVQRVACCAFVDGRRRIDVRLFAEAGGIAAPALAGSWAVGAAWSTLPPRIDSVRIGRTLVVGGRFSHSDLVAVVGGTTLTYEAHTVPGFAPDDPMQGLQNAMRAAEADLAGEIATGGAADLLVLDGPLTYFGLHEEVVGLVKRQMRSFLPVERAGIIGALAAGERTPLFLLAGQRLERYSCYPRLAVGRPIDGSMTGIVRLEVSAQVGLEKARRVADLAAATLPRSRRS